MQVFAFDDFAKSILGFAAGEKRKTLRSAMTPAFSTGKLKLVRKQTPEIGFHFEIGKNTAC